MSVEGFQVPVVKHTLKHFLISRLHHHDLAGKIGQCLFELFRGALEQAECAVVHGYHFIHVFEIGANRIDCMDWIHGKVSADADTAPSANSVMAVRPKN